MLFSVDVFFLCENDLKMGQTWDQLHCIIMIIIIIIDEMPFLNAAHCWSLCSRNLCLALSHARPHENPLQKIK